MAAWRYSASSYIPRDRSASRDSSSSVASKYGLPSSLSSSYSAAERPSRWSSSTATSRDPPPASRSNSIEEHGPVWAKTTLHTSPVSVVQRLKDRYSTTDTSRSAPEPPKRTETKDLTLPLSRTYGRTSTTNYNTTGSSYTTDSKKEPAESSLSRSYGDKSKLTSNSGSRTEAEKMPGLYTSRASLRKKTPEPEKSTSYEYRTRKPDYSPMESKPKIYTSSSLGSSPATSRYLGNKSRSGSSAGSTPNTPTTPSTERNYVLEKFERAQQEIDDMGKDAGTVVMITRSTSPTQPSASIYVRTRRADSSRTIEKTIQRPKIRPPAVDKECQADELTQPTVTSKFSTYTNDRVKPRASYIGSSGITSTYSPLSRYSGRTSNYPPTTISRYDSSDFRRSVSRDIPASSETDSRSRRSVSRDLATSLTHLETERYNRRSEEPAPIKSPPVKAVETPKVSSPSRPISTTPGRDTVSKVPSPSVSTSETLSKSSQLSTKSTPVTTQDKSETKGKSKSPLVISIATREKSKTPSLSEESKRARSKTQESDTSISVSGFSDVSKSKSKSKGSTNGNTNAFKQSPSPKVAPPDADSSESESESDETATTTTDSETADEVEELTKSSEPSSIKKSITNFLQNLPNPLNAGESTGSRSRLSLFRGKSGSTAKIKFKHIESGERAWWMDSTSDVPEGVAKLAASNKSIHHLAPNSMVNRQFSRDKDWLKNSSDEGSDRSGSSPLPPRPPGTPSPNLLKSSSPNHEHFNHVQGDNTLFLEVPKLPVLRQWSDEKPWWQTENDNSSKDNSISVEKELGKSPQTGSNDNSETDRAAQKRAEDTTGVNNCDIPARISPAKSSSHKLSPERGKLSEEDGK